MSTSTWAEVCRPPHHALLPISALPTLTVMSLLRYTVQPLGGLCSVKSQVTSPHTVAVYQMWLSTLRGCASQSVLPAICPLGSPFCTAMDLSVGKPPLRCGGSSFRCHAQQLKYLCLEPLHMPSLRVSCPSAESMPALMIMRFHD